MKKTVFIVYRFVLFVSIEGFCFAEPIEGYWVNVNEKTGKTMSWEIYQNEGTLYAKGFVVSESPVNFSLTMDKPGQWSGSMVIPNNGMLFKCRFIYHPADGNKYKVETLEMRGQIGIMGSSLSFTRSSQSRTEGSW
ncbi:hypothetical protein AGMMS49579_17520 [Spirochaetia bacterium]|nr:hypothetical protein AGMMS49579_17520 [Spirochaetia bacterium]